MNRLQENYNEYRSPKLYNYEECKLKCSEYNGLPSAFHKYEQVISQQETEIFHRGDVSASGKLFFIDSHYDFSRSQWYSGRPIIEGQYTYPESSYLEKPIRIVPTAV